MGNNEVLMRFKATEFAGENDVSVVKSEHFHFPHHWHDFYEIEVVTEGEGTFSYNGTVYTGKRGDISLLTPLDFHEMKADNLVKLTNIEFGTVYLTQAMREMMSLPDFVKFYSLNEEEFEQLLVVIELLQKECERGGPCIVQLLEYLFSRFLQKKQSKSSKGANKEYTNGVFKAISYMEQNFRESITLETLSEIAGYNPTYFSKMFRKVTGENFIERLTTLRINYAKMLLKHGVPVSETCFASGFGSVSNFVAVFKKRCGMAPGAYRDSKKIAKSLDQTVKAFYHSAKNLLSTAAHR